MEAVNCGNIRFSKDAVKELDGMQIMVSIPKAEITSIKLAYGESVEKPLVQITSGIILCLTGFFLGVWPLADYISHLNTQRGGYLAPFAFAAPLIVLGISLIVPVFRRRKYLLVTTISGHRKLPIKDCNPLEAITVARSLGYPTTETINHHEIGLN
jgi:hypothetical protein